MMTAIKIRPEFYHCDASVTEEIAARNNTLDGFEPRSYWAFGLHMCGTRVPDGPQCSLRLFYA